MNHQQDILFRLVNRNFTDDLNPKVKELRQFYATNMRKLGLMQELISTIAGQSRENSVYPILPKRKPKGVS